MTLPQRSPRTVAIERLARLVPAWPDLPFTERGEGGLADAIVQESVRRWRTLDWLIGQALERDPASIEAPLRAALLAGAAQLLLLDEPDFAVVDDTVEWAKRTIRPGAGRMANAVLRRVAAMRGERFPFAAGWSSERDALPLADGSLLRLRGALLPEGEAARLAVSTSHADLLIERWIERWGRRDAEAIAAHGLAEPPRIVADADGVLRGMPEAQAHSMPGFVVWQGSLESLRGLLSKHASLRVQDPGSALPVERTRGLALRRIVDACAGRGTKTRQLEQLHPDAEIFASDIESGRRRMLEAAFRGSARVRVLEPEAMRALRGVDLLVLDVPCSNTGVLARRPEAKCRFDARRLASLVERQRSIVEQYIPTLAPQGQVLYAVCSIEREELDHAAVLLEASLGRHAAVESRLPTGTPANDACRASDGGGSVLI